MSPLLKQTLSFKMINKPTRIYLVGLALTIYGLFTVNYSVTGGAVLPGIIAIIPLTGAAGLFLKKSWSRYFVHLFTIATVPWWTIYTIWFIWNKGWPYYPTVLQSIIGLLPGLFLCILCIGSSWVVHKYFKKKFANET